MSRLREKYDLKPLVIHTNYLVNMASMTESFLKKSIEAFRGELERGLALCADYLVLHPGSFRGADRKQALLQTAAAIAAAAHQLDLPKHNLTVLIENSAGAEYSLGGSFEQVAEVIDHLKGVIPVGACIDTCHTHVAGYDIVSEEGHGQDAERSTSHHRSEKRPGLALQRCQSPTRVETRPPSACRKGNYWP